MVFESCGRCVDPQELTEQSRQIDDASAVLLRELDLRMYILGRARQIEAEEHMLDKPGMYAANQISLRERQVAPIERATNGWHDAQERAERVVAALDCGEHPAVCLRARLALGIMAAEYVGVENLSAIIDSEPPESPEAESQP